MLDFVKIPFHDYRHVQMGDIMRSTQNIYKNLIVYTLKPVKQIKKSCVSSKYLNKTMCDINGCVNRTLGRQYDLT